MKQFLIVVLLSGLSRTGLAQDYRKTDTASPARARQLRDVIVRGVKPPVQQTSAGAVVNVQSSLLNKGSSVLEILERSPGVSLDHRNNSISLNGKSGVTVMIDGKVQHLPAEEVMALLQGMSADNIETIELLTTPPARYDASGNAGLINIVLKKSRRQGTTGSVSLNGGYGWGEKGGASVNVEHNSGKTDWYGSYSFLHDHAYSGFLAMGTNISPAIGPSGFVFHDTNTWVANNHSLQIGVETRLRRRFILGGSLTYYNNTDHSLTNNLGDYTLLPDSVLVFDGTIHGRSHWNNFIASVTAEKEWQKAGKLGLGLDWLAYTNDRPSDVLGSFVDSHGGAVGVTGDSLFAAVNRGYSGTTIRVGVGKLDYSLTLKPKLRLEAGVKGDLTQSRSSSGIESLINGNWAASAASVNAIHMRDAIVAAYASGHVSLNESTTLDAGLRYEYSDTRLVEAVSNAPIVRRRLGVFFPSLLLSRKTGKRREWLFSYTKRITRPSYKDLSSFIGYNDPFSVFTGNPLLKPTITQNLKIGYLTHGYSFSLLYSRDENPIFGWALTAQPGSELVYIRPVNLSFQNTLNFEMNLPFTVSPWWTMSYGVIAGWRQYRVPDIPVPVVKGWFGNSLHFHENFRLPAGFSTELSGWYNGPSYDWITRTRGVGEISWGVKKEFGKSSLQFSVTDIFRMMNYKTNIGVGGKDVFDTRTYISYDPESRKFPILRLSWSRSFGSGTGSNPKAERVGEEKERIK